MCCCKPSACVAASGLTTSNQRACVSTPCPPIHAGSPRLLMRERIVHMSEISLNEDGNNYDSTSADVCNTDGRGCVPSQSRASRYAADGKRVKRGLQRCLHPLNLRQYHHQPLGTLRAGLSIEMIWVRNASNAAGRASPSTTTEEPTTASNAAGRASESTTYKP
jgi:hypothetical protein